MMQLFSKHVYAEHVKSVAPAIQDGGDWSVLDWR